MKLGNDIVILDLSNRGKIEIKGEDSLEFLQNISSNDVRVSPGKTVRTAFLNNFGKLIGIVYLHKTKEGFILDADVLATSRIVDYIQKKSRLTKSTVENITYKKGLIHAAGDRVDYLLDDIESRIDLKEVIISRNDRFKRGYDIFVPGLRVKNIFDTIMASGLKPIFVKPEDYEILRIKHAIPEFGRDYDENYTIMEVGTEDCVSYNKGCYIGQEIIARMKTYGGKLPKKIVSLTSLKKIEKNSKLFKNKEEIGKITSFVEYNGEFFYLATIKRPFYERGEEFEVDGKKLSII